ncbi:hypothetical protein ABZ379_06100 [Streptomyces canus]
MEPLTPAAVRAASVVTKAAISRYRCFLDAIAHVIDTQSVYFYRAATPRP